MKQARDPDTFRAALAAKSLSQAKLAKLVGCSQATIFNAVSGRRPVSHEIARRIARNLGRRIDDLFVPAMTSGDGQNGQQCGAA